MTEQLRIGNAQDLLPRSTSTLFFHSRRGEAPAEAEAPKHHHPNTVLKPMSSGLQLYTWSVAHGVLSQGVQGCVEGTAPLVPEKKEVLGECLCSGKKMVLRGLATSPLLLFDLSTRDIPGRPDIPGGPLYPVDTEPLYAPSFSQPPRTIIFPE
jgi:hypothetical protein